MCGFKKDGNAEEIDEVNEDSEPSTEMPSQEELNDLAVKLKSMSVMLEEMPREFWKYSQQINDVSKGLRSTFRRIQGQKLGNKAISSRQSSLMAFLTKSAT